MSINKNLVANFAGQAWVAFVGLAFVPLYIRYLGIEAFGLIGFFTALQAWLALLDMGLTPTLNREMARFSAGAHSAKSIRDLLFSVEIVAGGMALGVGLVIGGSAGWIGAKWLNTEKLGAGAVQDAIMIMALIIALRFLEGLYRGAMLGLQRQVSFNILNAGFATLRAAGAVAVLVWFAPTIEAYFLWQATVSVLTVAALRAAVHLCLPAPVVKPAFSLEALTRIWRFAAGILATTFLGLLLTQADKILLSRLLTLETFGYYTFASTVAAGIAMLVAPVTQTYFPRFSELAAHGAKHELSASFHAGARLVTAIATPCALALIFFGEDILVLWTGDRVLAANASPLLALLSVGTLLNVFMHIPYVFQLASGWPGLAARMNLVAVVILLPAIFWVTPRHGPLGTAWILVVLNAGYLLAGGFVMFRRLLRGERWVWYLHDVALPLAAGGGAMIVLWQLFQSTLQQLAKPAAMILAVTASFAAALVVAILIPRSTATADKPPSEPGF